MVDRYKQDNRGDMYVHHEGTWVEYWEYKVLLDKYNDLVTHVNGLSKIHSYEPSSGMGDDGGGSPGRWPDKYGMGRSG